MKDPSLVHFGLSLFADAAGQGLPAAWRAPDGYAGIAWGAYLDALGPPVDPRPRRLRRIFSLVRAKDGSLPPPAFWPLRPLALEAEIFAPGASQPAQGEQGLAALWRGFSAEYETLLRQAGWDERQRFTAFYYLMQKWLWTVPADRCGEGVSLFEEWKAVAALVYASGGGWQAGPAAEYTLVGGDIPGIQDFIYTLASRGAARSLRGRSFFVQLLGEAAVQRLLDGLDLSPASVIYAAGGNFMLLAGADQGEQLEKLAAAFEDALLAHYAGDLSLCLAWKKVPLAGLFGEPFACHSRDVKDGIADQKLRRFSRTAADQWERLFAPDNPPGGEHCTICQRMLARGSGKPRQIAGQPARVCPQCLGFEELAGALAGMKIIARGPRPPENPAGWQAALHQVGGAWVTTPGPGSPPQPGEVRLAVNRTDFLAAGCQGFRLLAQATPRATAADVEANARLPEDERDPSVRAGSVRTLELIARSARGMDRLGFLRMDVDHLGAIFGAGLARRGLPETSALSAAADAFFSGWLNVACEQVNQAAQAADPGRGDGLYAIFAGGDDLFVVGAWDLLPELADRVRADFQAYAGANPAVHLSGGLVVEDPRFPLYQAFERAGAAEQRAKNYRKDGEDRDAFAFLGVPVKWADWPAVLGYRAAIEACLASKNVSEALVQNILNIYAQYEAQVSERTRAGVKEADKIVYGPWMWRAAYALSRAAQSARDREVSGMIRELQSAAANPGSITLLALAARWVNFLRRKE